MFNDLTGGVGGITGKARIKVIGVGGAGNNAVNRMLEAGIDCAEYYVVNTDSQTLVLSPCEHKIQIGTVLTKGLGAGADPEVGRGAAEESKTELTEAIKNTDLLFITAGMGGGTGTGAAPVIAKIARDMKILTVAVVTEPFGFEGRRRKENTIKGLDNLKNYVDSLIVIPNDKLRTIVDRSTTMVDAFCVADDILKQGIRGIAELIVNPALINLDFADVRTILKDSGIAHLGVGVAKGENRILEAVRVAINSPLLETTIEGARGVIINVCGGNDLTMAEGADAAELISSVVDASANIIFGVRIDPNVQDEVEITVIATGFPGYDNRHDDEQRRSVGGGTHESNSFGGGSVRRMSVSESPYYRSTQPLQPAQPVQPVQPVQPQPLHRAEISQPPVQNVQYQQTEPPVRGVYTDEERIERPTGKSVPKFIERLKNFGKKTGEE